MNQAANFIGHFVIGAILLWVVLFLAILIISVIANAASKAQESMAKENSQIVINQDAIKKIPDREIQTQAKCDLCGKYLKFPAPLAGKTVNCPHCRKLIVLPSF